MGFCSEHRLRSSCPFASGIVTATQSSLPLERNHKVESHLCSPRARSPSSSCHQSMDRGPYRYPRHLHGVANVSLPHIAGGLGRSYDEVTWILTTYLVANAVILPMSAWFSRVFGRKNYYMGCVALFTIASFLCGVAPSLPILLLARVFQGIGGGGLAPVEQANPPGHLFAS